MNLRGRTILVTRPVGQADTLKALLGQHGADVRLLPMLAIEPLAADEPAVQAA
ncbi:MAG: uroporphyrinogen-III synthase, partial [Gammaproteobacteria bacterium]